MSRYVRSFFSLAALGIAAAALQAQTATPETHYVPGPAFDTAAISSTDDSTTERALNDRIGDAWLQADIGFIPRGWMASTSRIKTRSARAVVHGGVDTYC